MDTEPWQKHDALVAGLRVALQDGRFGLLDVPKLLKAVLREGSWRDRVIEQTGERQQFERFEQFIVEPPLEGLGATVECVRRLCATDTEALDALEQALEGRYKRRADEKDNVQVPLLAPNGNSVGAALRRLRKRRPDLHARVLAGELSPHAAMVAAGLRCKRVSVPLEAAGIVKCLRSAAGADWGTLHQALLVELQMTTVPP